MKLVSGLLAVGIMSVGLVSSSYTGQGKLNEAEQIAASYSSKTVRVIEMVYSLESENKALSQEVTNLKAELERNWNTAEEVNALIEETKVLRHRISVLEEQNAQLENELVNNTYKAELEKANQEIEKANQSAQAHLNNVVNTLDESVFDGILESE